MAKSKKTEDQIENTTETGVQEETPKKKTVKRTAKTKVIEPEETPVAEETLEAKGKTASSRTKTATSKTTSKAKDAETEQAPEKPVKRTRSKKADKAEEAPIEENVAASPEAESPADTAEAPERRRPGRPSSKK